MDIINKIIKNKRGVSSILGVILTLISISIISAYVAMNNMSWTSSEVQSIMDISATDALQDVINSDDLRKEIITVNKADSSVNSRTQATLVDQNKVKKTVKSAYMDELNLCLKTNSNLIEKIDLVSFDAGLENTMWGVNSKNLISGEMQARPQLYIDAVVQVTIKEEKNWDIKSDYKIKFFNAKSTQAGYTGNKNKHISVAGVTNDGKIVLTVRTLTRLIYR